MGEGEGGRGWWWSGGGGVAAAAAVAAGGRGLKIFKNVVGGVLQKCHWRSVAKMSLEKCCKNVVGRAV